MVSQYNLSNSMMEQGEARAIPLVFSVDGIHTAYGFFMQSKHRHKHSFPHQLLLNWRKLPSELFSTGPPNFQDPKSYGTFPIGVICVVNELGRTVFEDFRDNGDRMWKRWDFMVAVNRGFIFPNGTEHRHEEVLIRSKLCSWYTGHSRAPEGCRSAQNKRIYVVGDGEKYRETGSDLRGDGCTLVAQHMYQYAMGYPRITRHQWHLVVGGRPQSMHFVCYFDAEDTNYNMENLPTSPTILFRWDNMRIEIFVRDMKAPLAIQGDGEGLHVDRPRRAAKSAKSKPPTRRRKQASDSSQSRAITAVAMDESDDEGGPVGMEEDSRRIIPVESDSMFTFFFGKESIAVEPPYLLRYLTGYMGNKMFDEGSVEGGQQCFFEIRVRVDGQWHLISPDLLERMRPNELRIIFGEQSAIRPLLQEAGDLYCVTPSYAESSPDKYARSPRGGSVDVRLLFVSREGMIQTVSDGIVYHYVSSAQPGWRMAPESSMIMGDMSRELRRELEAQKLLNANLMQALGFLTQGVVQGAAGESGIGGPGPGWQIAKNGVAVLRAIDMLMAQVLDGWSRTGGIVTKLALMRPYKKGSTVVEVAARCGLEFVARWLVAQGVDCSKMTPTGELPSEVALRHGHKTVARVLLGEDMLVEQGHSADGALAGKGSALVKGEHTAPWKKKQRLDMYTLSSNGFGVQVLVDGRPRFLFDVPAGPGKTPDTCLLPLASGTCQVRLLNSNSYNVMAIVNVDGDRIDGERGMKGGIKIPAKGMIVVKGATKMVDGVPVDPPELEPFQFGSQRTAYPKAWDLDSDDEAFGMLKVSFVKEQEVTDLSLHYNVIVAPPLAARRARRGSKPRPFRAALSKAEESAIESTGNFRNMRPVSGLDVSKVPGMTTVLSPDATTQFYFKMIQPESAVGSWSVMVANASGMGVVMDTPRSVADERRSMGGYLRQLMSHLQRERDPATGQWVMEPLQRDVPLRVRVEMEEGVSSGGGPDISEYVSGLDARVVADELRSGGILGSGDGEVHIDAGGSVFSSNLLPRVIRHLQPARLVLRGKSGTGKSAICTKLAYDLAGEALQSNEKFGSDELYMIPVYISFSSPSLRAAVMRHGLTIDTLLREVVSGLDPSVARERAASRGRAWSGRPVHARGLEGVELTVESVDLPQAPSADAMFHTLKSAYCRKRILLVMDGVDDVSRSVRNQMERFLRDEVLPYQRHGVILASRLDSFRALHLQSITMMPLTVAMRRRLADERLGAYSDEIRRVFVRLAAGLELAGNPKMFMMLLQTFEEDVKARAQAAALQVKEEVTPEMDEDVSHAIALAMEAPLDVPTTASASTTKAPLEARITRTQLYGRSLERLLTFTRGKGVPEDRARRFVRTLELIAYHVWALRPPFGPWGVITESVVREAAETYDTGDLDVVATWNTITELVLQSKLLLLEACDSVFSEDVGDWITVKREKEGTLPATEAQHVVYRFPHRVVQEYLAAGGLVQQLEHAMRSTGRRSSKAFMQKKSVNEAFHEILGHSLCDPGSEDVLVTAGARAGKRLFAQLKSYLLEYEDPTGTNMRFLYKLLKERHTPSGSSSGRQRSSSHGSDRRGSDTGSDGELMDPSDIEVLQEKIAPRHARTVAAALAHPLPELRHLAEELDLNPLLRHDDIARELLALLCKSPARAAHIGEALTKLSCDDFEGSVITRLMDLAVRVAQADVRAAAITALGICAAGGGGDDRVVEFLVKQLGVADPGAHLAAIEALGQQGVTSAPVIEALLRQMKSGSPTHKVAAVTSLGALRFASLDVVNVTISALDDSHRAVHGAAARALRKIGRPHARVLQALVRRLGGDDPLRVISVADALGYMGATDTTSERLLLAWLSHRDQSVVIAAALTIRKQGYATPEMLMLLVRHLEDKDRPLEVKIASAVTLGAVVGSIADRPELCAQIMAVLIRIAAHEGYRYELQAVVLRALGLLGECVEMKPSVRVHAGEILLPLLHSTNSEIHREALNTAARVRVHDQPGIVAAMLAALEGAGGWAVRVSACEALALVGPGPTDALQKEVASALVDALVDPHPRVRRQARKCVQGLSSSNTIVGLLVDRLDFGVELHTRVVAAEVLGLLCAGECDHDWEQCTCVQQGKGLEGASEELQLRVLKEILGILKDPRSNPHLKRAAASTLPWLRMGEPKELADALVGVLSAGSSNPPPLRVAIVRALAHVGVGSPSVEEALMDQLDSKENWPARLAAAMALLCLRLNLEVVLEVLMGELEHSVHATEVFPILLRLHRSGTMNAELRVMAMKQSTIVSSGLMRLFHRPSLESVYMRKALAPLFK